MSLVPEVIKDGAVKADVRTEVTEIDVCCRQTTLVTTGSPKIYLNEVQIKIHF